LPVFVWLPPASSVWWVFKYRNGKWFKCNSAPLFVSSEFHKPFLKRRLCPSFMTFGHYYLTQAAPLARIAAHWTLLSPTAHRAPCRDKSTCGWCPLLPWLGQSTGTVTFRKRGKPWQRTALEPIGLVMEWGCCPESRVSAVPQKAPCGRQRLRRCGFPLCPVTRSCSVQFLLCALGMFLCISLSSKKVKISYFECLIRPFFPLFLEVLALHPEPLAYQETTLPLSYILNCYQTYYKQSYTWSCFLSFFNYKVVFQNHSYILRS
jgi:hypothetical protein